MYMYSTCSVDFSIFLFKTGIIQKPHTQTNRIFYKFLFSIYVIQKIVVISVCGVAFFRVKSAVSIGEIFFFFVSAVELVLVYTFHHVVGVVDFLSYAKLIPLGNDAVDNGEYSVHHKERSEVVKPTTWEEV